MATIIKSSEGDLLDLLAWGVYGNLNRTVERVLDVNPGLADIGQPYPAGLLITFPDLPAAVDQGVVRLWS